MLMQPITIPDVAHATQTSTDVFAPDIKARTMSLQFILVFFRNRLQNGTESIAIRAERNAEYPMHMATTRIQTGNS